MSIIYHVCIMSWLQTNYHLPIDQRDQERIMLRFSLLSYNEVSIQLNCRTLIIIVIIFKLNQPLSISWRLQRKNLQQRYLHIVLAPSKSSQIPAQVLSINNVRGRTMVLDTVKTSKRVAGYQSTVIRYCLITLNHNVFNVASNGTTFLPYYLPI